MGPCHHGIVHPVVKAGGDWLHIWSAAAIIFDKYVHLFRCAQNAVRMQLLTAVITCVLVSGVIFKTISLLFQQIAQVTDYV